MTQFKCPRQTTHLKDSTKEENYTRIRAAWRCFGKNKEVSKTDNSPFHHPAPPKTPPPLPPQKKNQNKTKKNNPTKKTTTTTTNKQNKQTKTKNKTKQNKTNKKVMDQCVLPTMTYGCKTWSLNKQLTNKLRTAQ